MPAPDAVQAEAFEEATLQSAGIRIRKALRDRLSEAELRRIEVRLGRAAVELNEAAEEMDAQAIVIGGKRHSTFGRWFGSSTGHGLARLAERPVVVAGPSTGPIKRVLAAIDFSESGRSVLSVAEAYAGALHADLRFLSVIEPLPVTPGMSMALDHDEYYQWSEAQITSDLWSQVRSVKADKVVRIGHPVETLLRELTDWAADLVILGSHGRNFVLRALLGSVSEELLNQLPTSLILVPPVRRADSRAHALTPQLAGAL